MLGISFPVFSKQWTNSDRGVGSQSGWNVKGCCWHVPISNDNLLFGFRHRHGNTSNPHTHTHYWITLQNKKALTMLQSLIMLNLLWRDFGPPTRPLAVNVTAPSALYSKHSRKYKSVPRIKPSFTWAWVSTYSARAPLYTLTDALCKAVLIKLTFVLAGSVDTNPKEESAPFVTSKVWCHLREKKKMLWLLCNLGANIFM